MTRHATDPSKRTTLLTLGALVVAGAALGVAGESRAQVGEKVVRIILPVATASGVDTITRAASPALAKALGYPVAVENQPGAGGIVGTSARVAAAPEIPTMVEQGLPGYLVEAGSR